MSYSKKTLKYLSKNNIYKNNIDKSKTNKIIDKLEKKNNYKIIKKNNKKNMTFCQDFKNNPTEKCFYTNDCEIHHTLIGYCNACEYYVCEYYYDNFFK